MKPKPRKPKQRGRVMSNNGKVVGSKDVIKEVGVDEAWKANIKRTYDRAEENLQTVFAETQKTLAAVNSVQLQALANMQENANALSKQMLRHSDIAADRQWNVDEQGYQVNEILRSETFRDAIAAAVAVSKAK